MVRKKKKFSKKPNWLDLPIHVWQLISDKLLHTKDYVRFGAVCRPWHSIYTGNRRVFPHQLPMLMFSPRVCLNRKIRYLYDIHEKNYIYTMNLTMPRDTRCYGSTHGWLVTMHEKDRNISLLNPFLSYDNVIELPKLDNALSSDAYIMRAALSANPANNPHYAVMIIYRLNQYYLSLAYYNPELKFWVSLDTTKDRFEDIIYHKDQFYAVDCFGILWKCNACGSDPVKVTSKTFFCGKDDRDVMYLVESCGELLQIRRRVDKKSPYLTKRFRVFKLDKTESEWDETEINNLSGQALFVGDNTSFSILASDFSGCMPNSIYFTEEWCFKVDGEQHGVGVYNMEDGSIKPLPSFDSMARVFPTPIWIEPTLRRHLN